MNTPLTKLRHVQTIVEGETKSTIFHKDTSYGHTAVVTVERSDKFGYPVGHDPQLFFMKDIRSLHAALGRLLGDLDAIPPF